MDSEAGEMWLYHQARRVVISHLKLKLLLGMSGLPKGSILMPILLISLFATWMMRYSSLSKCMYDTKVGGYAGWQGSLSEGPEQARMGWPEPPGAQQGQV